MNLSLEEIASLCEGEILSGDRGARYSGFAGLDDADGGDVSFLGNPKYAGKLGETGAGVVLVPLEEEGEGYESRAALVAVENPSVSFALLVGRFGPKNKEYEPGVHATAFVDASAELDPESVHVGPNAVVEAGVRVGRGSVIAGGAYVGDGVVMGEDCLLHPNVTVRERCVLGDRVILNSGCVIGSDGFGFELKEGRHVKVDQVGIVMVENDVEIGSNTSVDRARFGKTVIGEGTKIDNLVQVAHNVVTGKHCLLVSQVGVAGSTKIGDYVTMAAQSGIAGHLELGDRSIVVARGGVTKSFPEAGGVYMDFPAEPAGEARRKQAMVRRLPELRAKVKELEERV